MNAKLNDKTRKNMIADRVNGMSFRALAKKYGVSTTTIYNSLKKDPETERIATIKKQENTQEMLEYMDAQKGYAQKLLSSILEALGDEEKLARANVRDLATAYGIIADKFIQTAPQKEAEEPVKIVIDV